MSSTHTVMFVTFCVRFILYLGVLLCQCLWNLLTVIASTCQFSQHNLKCRWGTGILWDNMRMLNSSEHLKYCSPEKKTWWTASNPLQKESAHRHTQSAIHWWRIYVHVRAYHSTLINGNMARNKRQKKEMGIPMLFSQGHCKDIERVNQK
jgi:hypothetical protein